jgi:NADP-dependent 3-hydroxy acid dehydrogenase YdfG
LQQIYSPSLADFRQCPHLPIKPYVPRIPGLTRQVLITGASAGIGKATAYEFARAAAPEPIKLVITARRVEVLQEIKKDIESKYNGTTVVPVKLDVSDADQVRGLVKSLPKEVQDIDILVNNAYYPLCIGLMEAVLSGGWRKWAKLPRKMSKS